MPVQFFPADTMMHRMDAISKLALVMITGAAGFLLSTPELAAANLAIVLISCFILGGIPFRKVKPVIGFLVLLALALIFFQVLIYRDGTVIIGVRPFTITDTGLLMGLLFAVRVWTISFASLTFVWTTDPKRFVIALIRVFRVPYRIAYGVFVALRFLPLMSNELKVIKEAHAVRGVSQVSGRLEAYKRYTVPLLVSGIRKAETVALAMDSRAFGVYPHRTYLEDFEWSKSGIFLVLTVLVLEAMLIYLNLTWGFDLLKFL